MNNEITTINKEVIKRLYKDVLSDWNMDLVDEFVAPPFRSHDMPANSPTGPKAFRDFYSDTILSVLPDARYEMDDLVAEGDKVVVRWRLLGTHKGVYLDIEPTGKLITLRGIAIYRLENSMILERWVITDLYGLFQELKKQQPVG
jgi:predicted ester cyclase